MQKNTLLLICFFLVSNTLFSQVEYNMQDALVTDCEGILYDSGGPDGDYGMNEEFTFTICPEPAPVCIQLDLGTVVMENNFERLIIFDGFDINSPILLNHDNGLQTLPIVDAHSGCITIYFQSDQTTALSGWKATWKCFEEACPIPMPILNEGDCVGAIPVCQEIFENLNGYVGEGNVLNEINPDISCFGSGERNSVWYKLNILESGELAFLIIPNQLSDDYDWAVFNLTHANCSDISNDPTLLVSCNYSSDAGITGAIGANPLSSNQNATIPVQKGEIYLINISQFTPSPNGFALNFSFSDILIDDSIPPIIENPNEFVEIVSTTEVRLHFSEDIQCESMESVNLELEGYNFAYNTFCNEWNYSSTFTYTITPPLEMGSYVLNLSGDVADVCGNTSTFNENIAFEADDILGLPPIHQSAIQLYPNPTSEILFLQFPGIFPSNVKTQLEVFDLQGRKVEGQLLEGNTSNEIDVRDYPRGVYFVKVQIGGKMWGEKVLLE